MIEQFSNIEYAETAAATLDGADGTVVVTDWDVFGELDEEFDAMSTPVVVDVRQCIERHEGLVYEKLAW